MRTNDKEKQCPAAAREYSILFQNTWFSFRGERAILT